MRVALATSFDGSARCRAPRSWTQTSVSGQLRSSAPVAPAWSKWMCVSRIARGTQPSSSASSVRMLDSGPGSTMTSSTRWQHTDRGTPWKRTSISSIPLRHHDVLEGDELLAAAPRSGVQPGELEALAAQRREDPLVVVGDGLLRHLLADDRHAPLGVEEGQPRLLLCDERARRVVEQEERREEPPARRQHPRRLEQLVLGLLLEQVGEHGREDDEVERAVVEREAVVDRLVGPAGVVLGVVEVGDAEVEVRVAAVAAPAPADPVAVDVEALV